MPEIAVLSNENTSAQLINFLNEYNRDNGVENRMTVFSSARELCVAVGHKQKFDLIFFDLDITACNTMKTIECVRKHLLRQSIGFIFISSLRRDFTCDIIMYGFECMTLPITYEKIKHCMDVYLRINTGASDWFVYLKKRCKHNIKVSEIVYLEGCERKTIIHTEKNQIEIYSKLSECIKESCFSNFIETHKSFWVNPAYIEWAEHRHLIVRGKAKIPISRHKMRGIAELFAKQKKRYLKY